MDSSHGHQREPSNQITSGCHSRQPKAHRHTGSPSGYRPGGPQLQLKVLLSTLSISPLGTPQFLHPENSILPQALCTCCAPSHLSGLSSKNSFSEKPPWLLPALYVSGLIIVFITTVIISELLLGLLAGCPRGPKVKPQSLTQHQYMVRPQGHARTGSQPNNSRPCVMRPWPGTASASSNRGLGPMQSPQ